MSKQIDCGNTFGRDLRLIFSTKGKLNNSVAHVFVPSANQSSGSKSGSQRGRRWGSAKAEHGYRWNARKRSGSQLIVVSDTLTVVTDGGRRKLSVVWQNLAEVNQAGRIRQNSVKASEFICRVFHRDVPAVTGLVPLQRVV